MDLLRCECINLRLIKSCYSNIYTIQYGVVFWWIDCIETCWVRCMFPMIYLGQVSSLLMGDVWLNSIENIYDRTSCLLLFILYVTYTCCQDLVIVVLTLDKVEMNVNQLFWSNFGVVLWVTLLLNTFLLEAAQVLFPTYSLGSFDKTPIDHFSRNPKVLHWSHKSWLLISSKHYRKYFWHFQKLLLRSPNAFFQFSVVCLSLMH